MAKIIPINVKKKVDRNLSLGGSDSNRLMRGEGLLLWQEKIGLAKPADLSKVLPVQLGIATESINLDWLENDIETKITRNCMIEKNDFLTSNLDGFVESDEMCAEAKHTYEGNTLENVITTYFAQLQHYMMHSKTDSIYVSAIFGNRRWEKTVIHRDPEYIKKLMAVLTYFWECVETKTEPTKLGGFKTIEALPVEIPMDGMTRKNMTEDKNWKEFAEQLISDKVHVDSYETMKTKLKDMVPDDCYEAIGNGVVVTQKWNKRYNKYIKTLKTKETKDGE